ncbi:MAG TPA: hypothetical protein VJN68_14035, partial [Burkholderiaceae bacterium]|nr:hypothetical protein [Burkholderiaceae bacterium]
MSLFVAISGCARLVPLRRDQLAALTAQPRSDTVVLSQDGERVVVQARQAPELELRLDCGFWERMREPELCNGGTLSGPLDRFHVEGDRVRVRPVPGRTYGPPGLRGVARSPEGDHVVELGRVADVRLYLRHYERPGWRPRWGLGVSAAGPSLLMSITGQFRPARWLTLE